MSSTTIASSTSSFTIDRAASTDVFTLEYRLVPRPIYPLDPMDDWRRAGD